MSSVRIYLYDLRARLHVCSEWMTKLYFSGSLSLTKVDQLEHFFLKNKLSSSLVIVTTMTVLFS